MARRGRQLYPYSLRTHFGAELRRLREASGLSMLQLGEALGYSHAWIGAIELGDEKPSPEFAQDADTYYKTDGMLTRLLESHEREIKRPKVPPNFPDYADLESEASVVRKFDALLINGLVQTVDYARHVLAPAKRAEEQLEEILRGRITRQAILDRQPPPRLWIVHDEWALRRALAPPEVMKAQYDQLIELSLRSSIVFQVVPYREQGYAGLEGSFTVLDFDDRPGIAYMEAGGHGQVIENAHAVTSLAEQFELIRAEALPVGDSRDLVRDIMEGK